MINFFDSRFFKFGIVGLSGMVIDFSITWICKEKFRFNKYLSNSLGFILAVLNNFILNRYWTFQQYSNSFTGQLGRFVLVSISGLAINNLLLFLLLKYTKINFYLSKLIVIALVFFWNYLLNLLYTFN